MSMQTRENRAIDAAGRVRARTFRRIERIKSRTEKKAARAASRARRSIAGRILSGISVLIMSASIAAAVFLGGVRVMGYTPYAVLSGSMTPAYNTGDMVYVRYENPLLIRKGDVITYVADGNLTLVTHRVLETRPKERTVITQGDANNTPDAKPVLMDNIVGVVRFSVPRLGYVSEYLSTASGRYSVVTVILALIGLTFLPELIGSLRTKSKFSSKKEKSTKQ